MNEDRLKLAEEVLLTADQVDSWERGSMFIHASIAHTLIDIAESLREIKIFMEAEKKEREKRMWKMAGVREDE